MKPTPPQIPGPPLIGNTLEFMRDRSGLFQRGFEALGPIFAIKLLNQPAAVLIGPEYQQLFFTETDKTLSIHKTYRFLKAALGEVAFAGPPEVYNAQRPILHLPFKSEKMHTYLQTMQVEVQQWLDSLGEQGELELTAEITALVQNIAANALMGKAFRSQIGREFWNYYPALSRSIDPILPPSLPLPKFLRRDRARRKLLAMLRPIIAERRTHPEGYDDFLQDFATARYKDGRLVDDETILAMVLGLMFAGHETTAGQAAWTIIQILQHPAYKKLLQHECAEHLSYDQPLDAKVLKSLAHVFFAVQETTRMYPSADILIRLTEAEIEIGEYRIPKGWALFVSPALAQRLPTLFAEPQQYDPLRFAPGRQENHHHRFAMIGFGGGFHKCAGMNFANNEMMIITALLFQQFDLELVTQKPQVVYGIGACHPEKTLIRYSRKKRDLLFDTEKSTMAQAVGCPHILNV